MKKLKFFSKQCTPLESHSIIPEELKYLTNKRLSWIDFSDEDITKIIRGLDISKAHGHDDISVRMIKMCDSAISKPLRIIFQNCLESSTFPDCWKRANVVPIHKKGDKQILNNYSTCISFTYLREKFSRG